MSAEAKHPSRSDRQKCWKVRDSFFACLDGEKVLDPSSPEGQNNKACKDLRILYESACMKSWVDYFNKRRVLEVEQKEILEKMRAQHQAAADRAKDQAAAKGKQ